MANLKTNFFESVAKHNLERFHSEIIAWIFNTFPMSTKNFIKSFHEEISSIDEIVLDNKCCKAEVNQIDIKLEYKIASVTNFIVIENKLKATEHKIPYKVWSKELPEIVSSDFLTKHIKNELELSQTEYYYIREMNKFSDSKSKFIYLLPNIVNPNSEVISPIKSEIKDYNFEKLNFWTLSIVNQWITINYKDFFDKIGNLNIAKTNNNEDPIIANGYLNYIKSDKFSKYIDLENFNNNVFGRFEYFKLLFAIVKMKFIDKTILNSISNDNKENSIYEYIEAGSSNGGSPLFAFYKKIELNDNFNFFTPQKKIINIGIQVQGENIKYYISADVLDYDKVTVKSESQKKYGDFVKKTLQKLSIDFEEDFNGLKNNGFHTNKTKTFYSRSYKMIDFIKTKETIIINPRDIFDIANEISIKVNNFINYDITKIVANHEI
jgi:hypothetical protein